MRIKLLSLLLGVLIAFNANARVYVSDSMTVGPNIALPTFGDHKMGDLFPGDPPADYCAIDETFLRAYVAGLDDSIPHEFDYEGNSLADPSTCLPLWDYTTNPTTAVSLKLQAAQIISSENPDLRFCLYGIPDHNLSRQAQKFPDDKDVARRVSDYAIDMFAVTAYASESCWASYWRSSATYDATWLARWKSEIAHVSATAQIYHNRKGTALIWHRGYEIELNDATPKIVDIAMFREMVRYTQCELEMDVIFWSQEAEVEYPDSHKAVLIRYANGC